MSGANDSTGAPPAPPAQPPRRWRGMWLWPLVALLAFAAALYASDGEPGLVVVALGRYSVETSVWFAMAALVAAYLALRLLGVLWRGVFGSASWLARRRAALARKRTLDGLLALLAGDWAGARKLLLASVTSAESPGLNLIFAARAAAAEGDHRQAEDYLRQAELQLPGDRPAAALERLELATARGDDAALPALQALRARVPSSPGVARALAVALERARDWPALRSLLPDLRKLGALPAAALLDLELRIFRGACRDAQTLEAAQRTWANLARGERGDAARVLAYALALHRFGADAEAEPLLREAIAAQVLQASQPQQDQLKQDPLQQGQRTHALVALYGLLRADLPLQARHLQQWLAQRPDDGALLQAVGRVQGALGDWEAARNAFMAAQQILDTRGSANWGATSQHCAAELARALLELGDVDAARAQLRKATSAMEN